MLKGYMRDSLFIANLHIQSDAIEETVRMLIKYHLTVSKIEKLETFEPYNKWGILAILRTEPFYRLVH